MSVSHTTWRDRRLMLVRLAWVGLAVVILGLDALGLPYAYARYAHVCIADAAVCAEDSRLTPQSAQQLESLGIPQSFYAAYQGVGLDTVFTLVCFAVAAVVVARRGDDGMALFVAFVLLLFGGAGAAGTMHALPELVPALWLPTKLLDYLSQVSFGILFFVFPDGRYVPRWTRWIAAVSAVLFVPDIFFPDTALAVATGPAFIVFIASLAGTQIYRWRHVSTPEQRQQTKWVVFGFALAVAGFGTIVLLTTYVPAIRNVGPLGVMALSSLLYGFLLLIPVSITIAILRSGLWAIDTLINRTLVYATLSVLLALIYGGSVVLAQGLVRSLSGQSSDLAVVASTLVIVALFQPLRRRIQATIDRRFYRRKYDAASTLQRFSARLRHETNLDLLADDLLNVVEGTLQPAHTRLWLRPTNQSGTEGAS